jgi:hypothetical protein
MQPRNNSYLLTFPCFHFLGCPKLRELSLSFNSLENMDDLSFKDVGTSLGEKSNFAPFTNNIFFETPSLAESLEISFGLRMKIFPESALKPLQKLLWLSLDNNKIEEIRLAGRRTRGWTGWEPGLLGADRGRREEGKEGMKKKEDGSTEGRKRGKRK